VKTLLATIHVAFVGCHGNLVYRVVSWISVLGNLWELPVEGSHITEEVEILIQFLETRYQLEPPMNRLKIAEDQVVINSLNPKKSLEFHLINNNILKELPITRIKYLTQLFNAVQLKGHIPAD
jgi:hypothetical protein